MLRTVTLNTSRSPDGAVYGAIREKVPTNPDYAALHPGYGLHSCITSVNKKLNYPHLLPLRKP